MLVNFFNHSWRSGLATFCLAGAAAASLTYWILLWPSAGHHNTPPAPQVTSATIDSGRLARLLGQAAPTSHQPSAAPPMAARFVLVGVMAQGSQRGSALIAVDGTAAKPFRVGETVAEGQVLLRVKPRSVTLAADMAQDHGIDLALPQVNGAP
jgi:general secretion pathway protein C